jgi:hypothetical protein
MTTRRLVRLIVLSFSFAFVVTAAAGPIVAAVACAVALICALAARQDTARRAEAGEAEAVAATPEAKAAAEAVIAEAEAVIAGARLRLFGEGAF